MSLFRDPFDPKVRLTSVCACGRHGSQGEHEAAEGEALGKRVVEQAVMRALFPRDEVRRRFLSAVGAGTALAAVSTLFPLGAAKEAFAQGGGKLEKQKL
jgi:nitrate/nitrite transport system substrate-binding protein